MAISRDGQQLAVGGAGRIKFFEYSEREGIYTALGSSKTVAQVLCLEFSPDGKYLLSAGLRRRRSGGTRGFMELWDTETRSKIASKSAHGSEVKSVCWCSDGNFLATAGVAGNVRVRDPISLEPILRIDNAHSTPIKAMQFVGESSRKVVTTASDLCRVWNENGELEFESSSPANSISDFAQSDSTIWLAGDQLVSKIDLEKREGYDKPLVAHSDVVESIAMEGNWLVTAGRDSEIKVWDARTEKLTRALRYHSSHVRKVVLDDRATTLASLGDEGKVNVWRFAQLTKQPATGFGVAFSATTDDLITFEKHQVSVYDSEQKLVVRNSYPDDEVVGLYASNTTGKFATLLRSGNVIVRDLELHHPLRLLKPPVTQGRPGELKVAASALFVRDEKELVVSHHTGYLNRWDLESGELLASVELKTYALEMANLDDDHLLAGTRNGQLSKVELEELEVVENVVAHQRSLLALDVDSKSGLLATTGIDGKVKLWDCVTLEEIHQFNFGASWLNCLRFSNDGKMLVTGSEQTILFWDVEQKRELLSMAIDRCAHSISFSRDGSKLAIGGEDTRVRVWSLKPEIDD